MRSSWILAAGVLLTVAGAPAAAHHSFAAVFDRDRPIELTGTVTEVEWLNPHVWIYLDVKNRQGEVENWGFELGSPNGLIRRGWSRDALSVGQVVTIAALRARDDSHRASVRTVTLSTGESLFGAQDESR
jgi:Family of unknown function (DUF6152)